jgi:predicted nucleotidyltransferase
MFGEQLREARRLRGVSQAALARAAGTSQARISSYESGAVVPTESTQRRLLEALRPLPSEVLDRNRDTVKRLARQHHLHNVRVFGSVARGTDQPGSDVDLLVTAEPGTGLFTVSAFALDVEELLGTPVDVLVDSGLDPASTIGAEALAL